MEDEGPVPANIMYDRRVVRGNTYAAQVVAANVRAEEMARQQQNTGGQQGSQQEQEMNHSTTVSNSRLSLLVLALENSFSINL